MSMFINSLPFSIDRVDTSEGNAVLLGQLYSEQTSTGPKLYRLVKATAAISTSNDTFLAFSDRDAFEVDAKAAGETRGLVAGVVPAAITSIADGDYLFVQIGGVGSVITSAAVVDGAALLTTTGGKLDDAAAAFDDSVAYAIGTGGVDSSTVAVIDCVV